MNMMEPKANASQVNGISAIRGQVSHCYLRPRQVTGALRCIRLPRRKLISADLASWLGIRLEISKAIQKPMTNLHLEATQLRGFHLPNK